MSGPGVGDELDLRTLSLNSPLILKPSKHSFVCPSFPRMAGISTPLVFRKPCCSLRKTFWGPEALNPTAMGLWVTLSPSRQVSRVCAHEVLR